MSRASTAAEPSMEEILASIRRIIADEDPAAKAARPVPVPEPAAAPPQVEPEEIAAEVAPLRPSIAPQPAMPPQIPPQAVEEDVLDLAMAQAEAEAAAESEPEPPAMAEAPQPVLETSLDVAFEDVPAAPPPPEPAVDATPPAREEIAPQPMLRAEPEPALPAMPALPPMPAFAPAREAPARASVVPGPSAPAAPAAPSIDETLISREASDAVSSAFGSLAHAIFSREPRTIEDLTKDLLRPLLKQWLDDNLPGLVERLVREEIERVARGRR